MPTVHQMERWLAAVSQGDRDAMAKLYDAASPAVYGYALSITQNSADAEDVLQECFVTILRTASQYKPQGKPMAWIITIAKNLSFKTQKRSARYLPLENQDYFSSAIIDPDDKLLLQGCMTALSDQERQIVILHAVAGCKHREIAEMLNLNPSTVLSKYHRAIQKIRDNL